MRTKILLVLLCLSAVTAFASSLIDVRAIGTTALTNYRVISTTPCKVFTVMGYNSFTAQQYVFLFEAAAAPTNGQAGRFGPFPVGSDQFYSVDLSAYGADVDKLTVGISTTSNTFTLGSSNCSIQGIIAR